MELTERTPTSSPLTVLKDKSRRRRVEEVPGIACRVSHTRPMPRLPRPVRDRFNSARGRESFVSAEQRWTIPEHQQQKARWLSQYLRLSHGVCSQRTNYISVSDVVTCEINTEMISKLFQNNFILHVTTV